RELLARGLDDAPRLLRPGPGGGALLLGLLGFLAFHGFLSRLLLLGARLLGLRGGLRRFVSVVAASGHRARRAHRRPDGRRRSGARPRRAADGSYAPRPALAPPARRSAPRSTRSRGSAPAAASAGPSGAPSALPREHDEAVRRERAEVLERHPPLMLPRELVHRLVERLDAPAVDEERR